MHKGLGHHLLVPSQYMRGGPQAKVFRGVVWRWGENWVYSGIPAQAFLGKCPTRMSFHPKEVSMGWNHLMHAIEVGNEEV